MSNDVSTCKRCRATVRWAAHVKTQNLAPIDVTKRAGGNVKIMWDNARERWNYTILNPDPEREAYTNHFATCPEAKAFRR